MQSQMSNRLLDISNNFRLYENSLDRDSSKSALSLVLSSDLPEICRSEDDSAPVNCKTQTCSYAEKKDRSLRERRSDDVTIINAIINALHFYYFFISNKNNYTLWNHDKKFTIIKYYE